MPISKTDSLIMQITIKSTISLAKQYPFEWNSFRAAKYRCTSPNATDFSYYGGRGIRFCFDSFQEFLLTLGRKPSREWTLERKDVNGDYEPENVKWATRREQSNNQRTNHNITAFGQTLSVAEWSRRTGIKQRNINFRHNAGWCLDCVLSTTAKTCEHGYNPNKNKRISARSKSNNHLITANGKTLTMVEWSEISGLKQTCISNRLKIFGWCETCAVTLPHKANCSHKNNYF